MVNVKNHKWAFFYTAVLLLFTVYAALDTFVIARPYNTNAAEINMSMFASDTAAPVESMNQEAEQDSVTSVETTVEKQSDDILTSPTMPDEAITEEQSSEIQTSQTVHNETAVEEPPADKYTNPILTYETTVDTSNTETNIVHEAAYIDEYEDDNISIFLSQYRINDTDVYVADINLSSAQYLKTAFAYDTYGKNMTAVTSEIAAEHDAIFAINGDYYGIRETGFVIRNGIVYRDTPKEQVLCIYSDGDMKVIDPYSISAEKLAEQGVWQAFSFGPSLVENGDIMVSVNSEVRYSKVSNPRTAIGMIDKLHYICVVSDGRTNESKGLSLYELANFMKELGADTAYNLDGGGSSSMVFIGKIINKPTFDGENIVERRISDIVYIG